MIGLRTILNWWRNRCLRRQMHRAVPKLSELDRQLAECRKHHKAGSARIIREKKRAVHMALAGGKTRLKVESR